MPRLTSLTNGGAVWQGVAQGQTGVNSASLTVSAAGANQAAATALTSDFNIVTTVGASTGVSLPSLLPGESIDVVNGGANALLVYPAVGSSAQINNLSANAGYSVAVNKATRVTAVTATQFVATGG